MIDVDDGTSLMLSTPVRPSTRSRPAFGDDGATAKARSETASLETTYPRVAEGAKTFDAAGIFGGPEVLSVHMKPTHEAQNPMVYGTHRRTPFANNTMSQAFAVSECTATRRVHHGD